MSRQRQIFEDMIFDRVSCFRVEIESQKIRSFNRVSCMEVLYPRWTKLHLSAYFRTLMSQHNGLSCKVNVLNYDNNYKYRKVQ